jgi:type IV secretory pathway ATPase VirB11/archaellum biosynthesis ATPase
MLPKTENSVLNGALEPLVPIFAKKNLVEVFANRPGELVLLFTKGIKKTEKVPELTLKYWEGLCHILANNDGTQFHLDRQPKLSTRLPGGHRFQAMLGKSVETRVSVSMRLKRDFRATFEDFGLQGEYQEMVKAAIRNHESIVISGGTSTGKTTFLNLLITMIAEETRILSVEDTRELIIPHHDICSFIVSRNEAQVDVGYPQVFDHLMRSSPTQVLLGEISVFNIQPALRLLNSGHRGFMCTIHADNAHSAIEQTFHQNIVFSGGTADPHYIAKYLKEMVNLVIQITRFDGDTRRVTELWQPSLNKYYKINQGLAG